MRNTSMKLAEQIKVTSWLTARKDTLLQHSQKDLCRMLEADTGIKTHPQRLADFERALGVQRHRGNMGGKRTDRAVVLAQELLRVQQELGMTISEDLLDIAERK